MLKASIFITRYYMKKAQELVSTTAGIVSFSSMTCMSWSTHDKPNLLNIRRERDYGM